MSLGIRLGVLLLFCAAHAGLAADPAASPAEQVPKEVRDLKGDYKGSWTTFGIDAQGAVVKLVSWTDRVKADNPQRQGDRVYVTTAVEMTFEGGRVPPIKVEGKDGYFLKEGGSLGDWFVEAAGQFHRGVKMAENVWAYTARADAQELTRMGFPSAASGQHVLIRVQTHDQGVSTDRITRVTTVHWKDKEGKERDLQFVSLQGFHERQ